MSPTDFSKLMKKLPQLADALGQVESWIKAHPHETFLDPRRLTRELHGASPVLLAAALASLASSGAVKPIFKVLAPNHVWADGEFESPEHILKQKRLYDTDQEPFDPREGDVLQVFLLPSHA